MKPKFALDLTHEGINLLHRAKGGWTLVGSVALDDPEMGRHLADLRRAAAGLESGGITCKIIIPNSQILYTTLEAPGPDDISREVQIRSGLDGLTPYPVGELVFDWRGAGERARVAVLARDTMDEAETFAVDHKFNPVSFVARPPAGEFSGEPFFGKTRAATKILGPTERVEPDASPVPVRPRASDGPSVAPTAPTAPPPQQDPTQHPAPDTPASPHSPGDLAWQPPSDPAASAPGPVPESAPGPVPEPLDAPAPGVSDADDPFAELDAIQAELSGDSDAKPRFRSQSRRAQPRPAQSARADQPVAPPLAPFPPTKDEADADPMPTPPRSTRKGRPSAKPAAQTPSPEQKAQTKPSAPAQAADAAKTTPPQGHPAKASPAKPVEALDDDLPAQPGVAFSTRRNGDGTSTQATPTARESVKPATGGPAAGGEPTPSRARTTRGPEAASDRRRADMADALSRPLPGQAPKSDAGSEPRANRGRRGLSDAVRGAAGSFRPFGQKQPPKDDDAGPDSSSMNEIMRGAGATGARISPADPTDEPGLLAPDAAKTQAAAEPVGGADKADQAPPSGAPEASPTAKAAVTRATPATPKTNRELPSDAAAVPAKTAKPASSTDTPSRPRRAAAAAPPRPAPPTSEAEALTVFGARRGPDRRPGRKYLGVILTVLLLLAMAAIAMWSSIFVQDSDPAVFNPSDQQSAPETSDPAPEDPATAADTPSSDPATGQPDAAAPAEDSSSDVEALPTPRVLDPEEADALYAETQIWQRAPETLGEPFTPALDMAPVGGPGRDRTAQGEPSVPTPPEAAEAPITFAARENPGPPPPADTVFDLDESGLVRPSPDGTVSPTGVIVFEGPPPVVPPATPERPDALAPAETAPETGAPGEAALEAALEEALEGAAEATTETPPAAETDPDTRPEPRPDGAPEPDEPAPDTAAPDATDPDTPDDAQLTPEPGPGAAADGTEVAGLDVEGAVDVAATTIVDATELAVSASLKPTGRPANIDAIVRAATARAAAEPAPAVPAAATTTPAIPTSASVANQATTSNAINLREINLLGISGPSNARRALVRMANGRYVTVKVGDRLDGGRVTSISTDGLTYQKGARNFTLQLLPLG